MTKKEKEEFLAGIENPDVRAHYAAQLAATEDWEGERTGGIFDAPGAAPTTFKTGFSEALSEEEVAEVEPYFLENKQSKSRRERILLAVVALLILLTFAAVLRSLFE